MGCRGIALRGQLGPIVAPLLATPAGGNLPAIDRLMRNESLTPAQGFYLDRLGALWAKAHRIPAVQHLP